MLSSQTKPDAAPKYVLNACSPVPAYLVYRPRFSLINILPFGIYPSLERAVILKRRRVVGYARTVFHIVTLSPWPLLVSLAVFVLVLGGVKYMHSFTDADILAKISFLVIAWGVIRWWWDVIYEGSYQGSHTLSVQRGLKIGFLLFIVSEIMFFAAFFWAFFHSSLSPAIEIGGGWPPVRHSAVLLNFTETGVFGYASYMTMFGLDLFNPWHIPFLNTLLLLSSGAWVTYVHAVLQRSYIPKVFARRHYLVIPTLHRSLARFYMRRRALCRTKKWKVPRRLRINTTSLMS